MNNFVHSITAFDANMNDVAIRLGTCQCYREKMNNRVLSDAGINAENGHLDFFELLKILKKRKDIVVSFYCIKTDRSFHIYSDFFNLDGAFADAMSFFNDINRAFMMCEIQNTEMCVTLIKRGRILSQYTVGIDDQGNFDHQACHEHYAKIPNTIRGLPMIFDVESSLQFLLQNYSKTEQQMQQYLKKNAIFTDQYIL